MKAYRLIVIRNLLSAALVAAALSTALGADTQGKYEAQPGSKVKIDGTSSIHDWTVEGQIIGGAMELGLDPQKATPGKVPAKVQVNIPVRSLKSGKKLMDDIMYNAMKIQTVKNIEFRATELEVKEAPKSANDPIRLESKGDLMVAGVTNKITLPVTIQRLQGGKLKTSGTIPLKMTQFGIQPPAPKIALGMITTGDEVKVSFEWLTAPAAQTAKN